MFKFFQKHFKKRLVGLILILVVILLVGAIKGDKGNPIYFQTERDGRVEGPFESSGSNSRFALTEAIVEDGTLFFNDTRARFAAPDLVHFNDKYFTIFTPGVSFISIPFYILGKQFGLQQIFAFSVNLLLLLAGGILVAKLANKLGANIYTSLVSGLVYMFGTNALAYSLTFTQHTLSVAIILLTIWNAIMKRSFLTNLSFGLLFGAAILADIPNLFMLLPAGFYVLFKNFSAKEIKEKIKLSVKVSIVGLLIGLLPLIGLFSWYNYQLTGSPTIISQMLGRSDYPLAAEKQNKVVKQESPSSKEFKVWETAFATRLQLQGFYVLLISNERGWVYYSPVLFIGIFGLFLSLRDQKNQALTKLLFSTGLMVLVIYSMFGDPYGGWAFGSRYLIPAAALMSVGVAVYLEWSRKNILLVLLALLLIIYSTWVSTIGALTTNAIPPKVEAIHLSEPIPYTYEYNLQFVQKNQLSPLVYNLFLKQITGQVYVYIFMGIALFSILLPYIIFLISTRKEGK